VTLNAGLDPCGFVAGYVRLPTAHGYGWRGECMGGWHGPMRTTEQHAVADVDEHNKNPEHPKPEPRVAAPGTCKQVGCEGWGTVDEHVRKKIGAPDTFAPYEVPNGEARLYIAPDTANRLADIIEGTVETTPPGLVGFYETRAFKAGIKAGAEIVRAIGEACR
jgi:hypothetical protein